MTEGEEQRRRGRPRTLARARRILLKAYSKEAGIVRRHRIERKLIAKCRASIVAEVYNEIFEDRKLLDRYERLMNNG